jgi:hypothetical protein
VWPTGSDRVAPGSVPTSWRSQVARRWAGLLEFSWAAVRRHHITSHNTGPKSCLDQWLGPYTSGLQRSSSSRLEQLLRDCGFSFISMVGKRGQAFLIVRESAYLFEVGYIDAMHIFPRASSPIERSRRPQPDSQTEATETRCKGTLDANCDALEWRRTCRIGSSTCAAR